MRWRGFGVTVEVPDRVARRIRSIRIRTNNAQREEPDIEFLDPPPQPRVVERDPVRALNLFRVPPGGDPPSWTPRLKEIPHGTEALAERVKEIVWYHTIELPGGLVTPGAFDHRKLASRYGFPDDMSRMTALDVATFDGFWAFEMERRGAEVTALDLETMMEADFPPQARAQAHREGADVRLGAGFELAHAERGSRVKKMIGNVYDLDPSTHGTFDIVNVGDLLIHLERPLAALRAIRSVTRSTAYIADVFLADIAGIRNFVEYAGGWDDIVWWRHSLDALGQIIIDAGFRSVRVHAAYRIRKAWEHEGVWRAVFIAQV